MVRLLPKTFRCQSNVKPDSQDITFFETWVKIELSLNTGSEQAGRQSAMDHTLHSKKLSQKMQTAFKNKQSHTMALKQTSDFNKYCHIVKAQSIDITYLSRHCGWRDFEKTITSLSPCSAKGCQGALTACEHLARQTSFCAFPFHIETFCQAAHTFQAMFKASSRCRFKQTECAFEKRIKYNLL